MAITLAEAMDSDMRVEIFYQTTDMSGLSARKSVVSTLYAGDLSCDIKLSV